MQVQFFPTKKVKYKSPFIQINPLDMLKNEC